MNVYQPPQSFMHQYNDPSFFNYEYQKYKAHLAAASNEDDTASTAQSSTPSAVQRNYSEVSEDRNQEDIQSLVQATDIDPNIGAAQNVSAQAAAIDNEGQYSNVTGNVSKEEMINISSCEFPEFKAFMSQKYGAQVFDQGFVIIKQNQDVIFEDNGEQ